MNWMRLFVWFLLLGVVLSVSACSPGAAQTPEGFARAEGDGFAFAYPQDWELTHDPADGGAVALSAAGTGDLRQQAAALPDPKFRGDFDVAVGGMKDKARLLQFDEWVEVADTQVEVAGAAQARLVESTWTTDKGVNMRQFDLLTLSEDQEFYYLFVNAAAADFHEATMRAIVDSFELRG